MNRVTAKYWTKKDRKAVKRAESFKELAEIAIRIIRRMPQPVVQVCGPITTGGVGTVKGNIEVFERAIKRVQKSGKSVFDQLPFEKPIWKLMKDYPRRWGRPNKKDCQLLDEFYGTIFRSGVLQELHFIHDWEYSFGACWEYGLGNELGMTIVMLER